MKQLAWLHARPKTPKGEPGKQTRMEAMGDGVAMPRCPAPYLINWLFEIGPGGDEAIGYRDFVAWQSVSGVELMPWEARVLRRMAHEYLALSHKATEPDCPQPFIPIIDERQAARDAVADKVAALFGGALKK